MSTINPLQFNQPLGLGQGLMALQGMPQGGMGASPQGFPQGLNSANTPRPGGMPSAAPGTQPSMPGASFWGSVNPFAQNVTATQNGQQQAWATPSAPNTNYVTPEAAQTLGQTFGANVVSQNLNGMASPGSGAPSAPMYGLDFGRGDVQDAGMGAFQLARGDSPELVAQRYAAGLNNTGWGGPAPSFNRGDSGGQWNMSAPVSSNAPSAGQSAFFAPRQDAGAAQFAANSSGQGNYGQSLGGSQGGQSPQQLISMLMQMLGIG